MGFRTYFYNLKIFLFLIFVLSFCGCKAQTLWQNRILPDPAPVLPDSFSLSGSEFVSQKFWEDFSDPQLDLLVEQALKENFSLKAAWDRLDQAQALAEKTGAGAKPSFSLSGETYRSFAYDHDPVSGNKRTYTSNFSLGLAASYELDLWNRVSSSARAAEMDLYGKEHDLRTAAITLASEVAETWYALVNNKLQTDLIREQIATDQEYLKALQLRKQLRSGTEIEDLLRQKQALESKRSDLLTLVKQGEILRHSLALLLGKTPRSLPELKPDRMPGLRPMPDTGLPAELIRRRPDVMSYEFSLAGAHQRLRSALADRFPKISFSPLVSSGSSQISDLFSDWLVKLSADLLQPLFDGGSRKAEVKRNLALTKEAFHNYSQAVLSAVSEVETALVNEVSQNDITASIQKQLDLSRKVEEQTLHRYRNGASDYLRVLEARSLRQALEGKYLTAQKQKISFRISLYRALAGGWTMEKEDLSLSGREKIIYEYLDKYE